jgi:serine/threonine protein kinase/Flp pilus assembly protein TadD
MMVNKIILKKYQIEEELQDSPTALIYRGADTESELAVILTAFKKNLIPSKEFLKRFRGTAEKLSGVDSPNAVSVLAHGEHQNQAVVVQEFIEGRTLSEMLKESAGLQLNLVLDITKQIGEYLGILHQIGTVHGGLDTTGIILAADGNVKVMNAGQAHGAKVAELIASKKIGARPFDAPEVRAGGELTPRSDFYALGAILFQALTGETLELDPKVPNSRSQRTGLLPELDELIAKCLHTDPTQRVQSSAEFLNGIEEVHRGMESSTHDAKLGVEDALVGHTLGTYQLVERLGQGGMATVYKAYEPALDRYVAVKILRKFFAQDPEFMQRFRREAKAIAKLNHPNIVPIHSYGEQGEIAYIVMRYVEGGTLKQVCGQIFEPERAVQLLLPVVRALAYAHQRGIVHRDIKPSNVLLSEGDWPMLTDYGLAKMLEATSKLTGSGVGMGTPMYMSPEQGQATDVDHRTDIYSTGIMLYELLTGDVPFQADTPMAIVIQHISSPMPMPRHVNPDIPEVLERIILKATAKSPDDRYQTADELITALEHSLSALRGVTKGETAPKEEAKSTAGKPKALDEEIEKHLERNYIDGLSAYWIKDWNRAQTNFQAVVAEQPDYKDVAELLAEVESNLKLGELYQRAQAAVDSEDWQTAQNALDELIIEDPGYNDASELLEKVKAHLRLAELYTQAKQLHRAEKWQAVVGVFEQIETLEPGYDPDGLLPEAQRALSESELETKLDDLYRQALDAMKAGDWGNARKLLEQVQDENPEYRETEQLLGRIDAETGVEEMPSESIRIPWLRKVPGWGWAMGGLVVLVVLAVVVSSSIGLFGEETTPLVDLEEPSTLSGQEYYELGVSLIDQEDYQGAIEAFEMALDQGWETGELYTKMGWALTRVEENETAITVYTKAIELDPLVEENWRERGWNYYPLGDYESAIEDFEKAIELDPEVASSYMGKALSYRWLEKPDEALLIYNRAIELFPDDAGLYNERGWLYFEDLEGYDSAINDFSMAIEIHPEGPHNHYFRGYVYQWLGRDDEARADFERVLEITGGDPSFEHHSYVVEWLEAGELAEGPEAEQQNHRFWREHGWTYMEQDNYQAALQAFDRALELNPEDAPAWSGRAQAARHLGEYETALISLGEAIALAPDFSGYYIDRGWFYLDEIGEGAPALSDFDKAIGLEPDNPNYYFQRGLAHQRLGQINQARENYQLYLEITAGDPDADWRSTIEQWLSAHPEHIPDCISAPPGLVSWWTGDGHVSDVIGGIHGTLINDVIYDEGKVGHAFFFPSPDMDGQDGFVEAVGTSNLDDLRDLTIEAWVMLNSGPAYRIERFVTIAIPDSNVPKAVLRIEGGPGDIGHLHFYMGINREFQHLLSDKVPGTGSFHHVAGTYDGSVMRLYLDGEEVGKWAVSGDVASGESYVFMSSGGEPLDGLLDEVSIYERALTVGEIQAIFEAGSAGKCKP